MAQESKRVVQAVLFDLDGTLLDTEVLSDRASIQAMIQFGMPVPPDIRTRQQLPWSIKKQILGLPGHQWIPMVLQYAQDHWIQQQAPPQQQQQQQQQQQEQQSPQAQQSSSSSINDVRAIAKTTTTDVDTPVQQQLPSVDEFWKCWESNLNDYCAEVETCQGAVALVQTLAAHNIPMAIATSSRAVAVSKKRIRHEESMFQYIQVIVTGDDPALLRGRGKPAPDIYLEAAHRLGIPSSQCMVVEDAVAGVQSGWAAKCPVVVAVPDPRFTLQEKLELFGNSGGSGIGIGGSIGKQQQEQEQQQQQQQQQQVVILDTLDQLNIAKFFGIL